ncbi:MAG: hypothetical protein Hyperionvirus41_9 [Hyperionvirus sp.]|uniref:Uncharacterized protein n=1 Tax=Hyperionvirus sp. TaxID=2487770 RepID=A0A3G5ACE3_9VIRU|nr:MAG: hypothetical protein Hyperionvirus41_9 [Hyperionvirus sp.]
MPAEQQQPKKPLSEYRSPYGFEFGSNPARTQAILRMLTSPAKPDPCVYMGSGGISSSTIYTGTKCVGPSCNMGSSERSSRGDTTPY